MARRSGEMGSSSPIRSVGPGQRYDVVWTAREPGKWLVHCHIPHHTTNNNQEQQGGGGLMLVFDVGR
jgi:FtsP/CotA-like multicopper oxidase with cupredoxin domain